MAGSVARETAVACARVMARGLIASAMDTERAMDAAEAPAAPLETDSADGVFEGGGVKGLAFVGALEAAEEAGITRWVNTAGTSAGAITASLLAVGYTPSQLRRILEATDYAEFADYGWGGKYLGGARNALRGRGLCPGNAFGDWLAERFAESPLGKPDPTFGDVQRELPPDLTEEERDRARYRLRVIASDISEGRMLVLPDDIEDYEDEDGRPLTKDALPIVRAVRMSMSFPYFFEPVTLRRNGEPHLIVDGGLLSNFPVFLFDGDKPPLRRWTFGFRLFSGTPPERPPYRRVPRPLWQLPLGKAMFFAATEAWDQRLSQATLVRTIRIPTGDVPTLDFTLSDSDRNMLRSSGHAAAEQFFATQRRYLNHAGVAAAGPAAV
jgi:NTE family protein